MDLHQLKTLVAVAREGSITRASEVLHLSQPAVSAHIKALEEALGLTLFERKARGMHLTGDGRRLLAKAEQTLAAHQDLLEEAARIKGRLTGRLRLGVGANSSPEVLGRLVTQLCERCPEVEVTLRQGDSREVVDRIVRGDLDAGFYNETDEPAADLATIVVSGFGILLAAPVGLAAASKPPRWDALADLPWVCPPSDSCCGRAAEQLFRDHGIRPERIIAVDRESVTRTLIAAGVGVGLLHDYTAEQAEARGEVEVICEARPAVRVLFAHLASRAGDPLLRAAVDIMRRASTIDAA